MPTHIVSDQPRRFLISIKLDLISMSPVLR